MTSFTHMKKQNTGDIIKKEKDHKGKKEPSDFGWRSKLFIFRDYIGRV